MKHAILSLAIASLFAFPLALAAQTSQTGQRTPSAQAGQSAPNRQASRTTDQTRVVSAEFVSYDAKTKVITIKDDKGQSSKAPLQGGALREMSQMHLKAGDRVTLTCRDNAKGEHQAVTDIKVAKSRA